MNPKLQAFLESLLERKFFFAVYSIIEKWVMLYTGCVISQNTMFFIVWRDCLLLIILGLITFEKIKVEVSKTL